MKNIRIRRARVFLIPLLAAALAGCAARTQHVTNLPPGVTQKQAQDWDTAVANLQKISTVTTTLRQAVIKLNQDGLFVDSPHYVTVLQQIGKIDQFQITAAEFLKKSPQTFNADTKTRLAGYLDQISQAITELNAAGTTGIKNPDSLANVNGLITQLTASANLILALTQ